MSALHASWVGYLVILAVVGDRRAGTRRDPDRPISRYLQILPARGFVGRASIETLIL